MELNKDFNINGIKEFELPPSDELNALNYTETVQLLRYLTPYYERRSEILAELGFEEWKKVSIWTWLYSKSIELEK